MIAALSAVLTKPKGSKIVLGIGDDAAAWRPSRSNLSVITTDALVEGVHFTRAAFTFEQIGHRALIANLSDVAAMGAKPVLATIVVGIPDALDPQDIVQMYRGIDRLARRASVTIVGGDIVRSSELFISITVIGEVRKGNMKTRAGAHVGDVVALTGEVGASRAALDAGRPARHVALPRISEGIWLGRSSSVHAMIDVSDGLSTDLARMTQAAQCGAVVETIPVAQSAREIARSAGEEPQRYAAAGGEDFELLVAIEARAFSYLSGRFRKRFGRPLIRVGVFCEGSGVALRDGERLLALEPSGWDHLA